MSIDIEQVRADTPGVSHVNHLVSAGASLMPQVVVDAMVDHLNLEAQIGGYGAANQQSEMLGGVYDQVANLLGAKPQEIAIVENATVGWCQAFYALPLKRGDRVLTCQAEYAANYVAYLHRAKRDGIIIEVIPNDAHGAIDVEALEKMLAEPTALISITWVPTNGGLVNPAQAVGKLAKKYGVLYLLDACQAVGQMVVNVSEIGCDFLSATARKFLRGPRGIGCLYVREALIANMEPVVVDHFAANWVEKNRYELRSDARRFETWENAYALRAGLGAALAYADNVGLANIQKRAWKLAQTLRDQLTTIKGAQVHDAGVRHCAIVSFSIEGLDPVETVAALRAKNIIIGTSGVDSSRLDFEARKLPLLLRAAPHYFNTADEIGQLVAALKDQIK